MNNDDSLLLAHLLREQAEVLVSVWRRSAARHAAYATPTEQAWNKALMTCASQLEQTLQETKPEMASQMDTKAT